MICIKRFQLKSFVLSLSFCNKVSKRSKYSVNMNSVDEITLSEGRSIIPVLSNDSHKGTCGRIGVFGGSIEFTGAPYFAGISALKTGADLVYVFTCSSAAQVIKSYSPELMVLPFLDSDEAVDLITPWLKRLNVILIGPGLGREEKTFGMLSKILDKIKVLKDEDECVRPLIFDADGLFYLMRNLDIIHQYPGDIYLTPNIMEFSRLCSCMVGSSKNDNMAQNLQKISEEFGPRLTIVLKWSTDVICNDGKLLECSVPGSNRRCGGQGDLLSGTLATFAGWVALRRKNKEKPVSETKSDNMLAAYNACSLTRTCNRLAFEKYSRSMLTTDMIPEIHNSFRVLFK